MSSNAEKETLKVLSVSLILVILQVILNTLGFGGMTNAITMYVMAISIGGMFEVDREGVRQAGQEKPPPTASDYLTRAGIDVLLVLLGLVMWFIATLWQGVEKSVNAFNNPDQAIDELAGGSWVMRLLYGQISHMTVFAFCQIWVNLYNASNAYYHSK